MEKDVLPCLVREVTVSAKRCMLWNESVEVRVGFGMSGPELENQGLLFSGQEVDVVSWVWS